MKKFYLLLLLLATTLTVSAQEVEITQEQEAAVEISVQEPSRSDARAQRGFFSDDCFVPKGQWIFGGTASFSAHRNNNYTFTLINGIDSEGYSVSVSPMIGYAPWKNMAVGIRFGYSRSLLALDNATLSVSGADLSVDMFHQLRHTYVGTLFWRPYIPLGHSNRFAFFAEVQLNLSGGQSKAVAATNVVDGMQNYRGTYAEQFGAQLALQPGIVAFITNNAAVELSIGVLGVGFDRTKQIKNQIFEANIKAIDTNFKLNLLSVGFGMSFYL
ncbi:MAG: hypothetical protein IIV76_05895 [Alistipes sp.]|nr:hypothetical protein [Alistipes sp.]